MGSTRRPSASDAPPRSTVFADYFAKNIQTYWTEALVNFTETVRFSGLWLDMNEPSSFSEVRDSIAQ